MLACDLHRHTTEAQHGAVQQQYVGLAHHALVTIPKKKRTPTVVVSLSEARDAEIAQQDISFFGEKNILRGDVEVAVAHLLQILNRFKNDHEYCQ